MSGRPDTDIFASEPPHADVAPGNISPWLLRHAGRLAPGSAILDVACGGGRHTRFLAACGHHVTATDIDLTGVEDLADDDRVELVECDLEHSPWPFAARHFDGIVMTNYLFRPLFAPLLAGLAAGGVLIIDTFAVGNEQFGKPRNPAFLLRPGELLDAFAADLHVIAYDHGRVDVPGPSMRQRLCAVRMPTGRGHAESVRRERCSPTPG